MPGHCSHPEGPSRDLLIPVGMREGEEGWRSLEVGHKAELGFICTLRLQPASALLSPFRPISTSKTLAIHLPSPLQLKLCFFLLLAEVPYRERAYRHSLLLPCYSNGAQSIRGVC